MKPKNIILTTIVLTIKQDQDYEERPKTARDNRKPAKLMFRFIGMNVWKQKGTRTSYKSRFSPVRRSELVSLFLTANVMTFQPLATLTNVATNYVVTRYTCLEIVKKVNPVPLTKFLVSLGSPQT